MRCSSRARARPPRSVCRERAYGLLRVSRRNTQYIRADKKHGGTLYRSRLGHWEGDTVMGSTKDTACCLTFGHGTEFHSYKQLEAVVATRCYFATPHHSWERGGNENAKGLVRQYLKKRVSMAHVTRCGGLHPIKESRAEFSKTVEQHLD